MPENGKGLLTIAKLILDLAGKNYTQMWYSWKQKISLPF